MSAVVSLDLKAIREACATPYFDAIRTELDALISRPNVIADAEATRHALNALAQSRGFSTRFVAPQLDLSGMGYEMTIDATGEVPTRHNLHDVFNALQWLAFPRLKTAINGGHIRHFASALAVRSIPRNVLTMMDESGVLVASPDATLLALLREFRWKELFVNRRHEVKNSMRFRLIGHGLMEKALNPFVGLTGKAVLLNIKNDMPLDEAAASWVREDAHLVASEMLAPLPLLGIPGWDARNEDAAFYDNTEYFRPGRTRRSGRTKTPA